MAAEERGLPPTMNMIYVSSVEKSREFYVEALGFKDEGSFPGEDGKTLAHADLSWKGSSLMIERRDADMLDKEFATAAAKGPLGRGVFFYYVTDDVDAVHKKAKKKGATITLPPTRLGEGDRSARICSLRDPDGYSLGFLEQLGD